MQAVLSCLLFCAVLVQVSALECYVCNVRGNCTEETCNQNQTLCNAVVSQVISGNDNEPHIYKGCSGMDYGNFTISDASSYDDHRVVSSSYYCSTNLCNKADPVIGLEWNKTNGFQCYTYGCSFRSTDCNKTNIHIQNCTGLENQCISTYHHSPIEKGPRRESFTKGCYHEPGATGVLGLQTSSWSFLYNYCTSSLCNNHTTDFDKQNRTLNGLKCFSYEGSYAHCSSQNWSIIECFEPQSHCADWIISSEGQGSVIKGCATPELCLQKAKPIVRFGNRRQIYCCQGSFCNGQVDNSTVMEERSTMSSTKASIESNARNKAYRNGGTLIQFPAALLMISASWNLMMNPSF